MIWKDNDNLEHQLLSTEVMDVSFEMKCKCLPEDYLDGLSSEISRVLPWFSNEPYCGLLSIGNDSGNGWSRTYNSGLFYLSRRTRLVLRVPKHRVEDSDQLSGQTLTVEGYCLEVNKAKVISLKSFPVLYAKYVIDEFEDEELFLNAVYQEMADYGIKSKKMLCGKSHIIMYSQTKYITRSLMIADLLPGESILLQERGLGQHKFKGCGIFIPHKDIKPVSNE